MKNKILLILLCFISLAIGVESTIGDQLTLSTVYDEHINVSDPRIKSIIYVAKNNVDSVVIISYKNYDGKQIANNLASIFDTNNLQYSTIEELKQSQDKVIIKIIKE
mgnify:CR=1 FL=1